MKSKVNWNNNSLDDTEPTLSIRVDVRFKRRQRQLLHEIAKQERTSSANVLRRLVKDRAIELGLITPTEANLIFEEIPGPGNRQGGPERYHPRKNNTQPPLK